MLLCVATHSVAPRRARQIALMEGCGESEVREYLATEEMPTMIRATFER